MAACVYPRCNACEDVCPVNAIDMSLAVPGRLDSSALVVKSACISCGLCERMCIYDAITFEAMIPKSKHVIDLKTCTYPKCTICVDHCPMNCIDFSTKPPTFHHYCEGCDLCYSLCPHDSISIPNLAEAQLVLRMSGPNHPFAIGIKKYEPSGRFRRLVPVDKVGFNTPAFMNKNAPRIVLNEDDEATYCDKPCKL
jgi:ferredoxin